MEVSIEKFIKSHQNEHIFFVIDNMVINVLK